MSVRSLKKLVKDLHALALAELRRPRSLSPLFSFPTTFVFPSFSYHTYFEHIAALKRAFRPTWCDAWKLKDSQNVNNMTLTWVATTQRDAINNVWISSEIGTLPRNVFFFSGNKNTNSWRPCRYAGFFISKPKCKAEGYRAVCVEYVAVSVACLLNRRQHASSARCL